MLDSLRAHTDGIQDKEAHHCIDGLMANSHNNGIQKEMLEQYLDVDDIRSFWDYNTELFRDKIEPVHVEFAPGIVKMINFIMRNEMIFGIISNSTEQAGYRILDFYNDRYQVALHGLSSFLSNSSQRKPNSEALKVFENNTNIETNPSIMTYIGDTTSDLKFARNIGAVGVLLIPKDTPLDTSKLSPKEQILLERSIITDDAGHLKNHIEAVMPNYSRPISLSVSKGHPGGGEAYIEDKDISISPTDDNIYRMATKGVDKIVREIPSIFEDFESTFNISGNRSVLSRPNYRFYFHDATGAILIPNPSSITNCEYKKFYQENRFRAEGDYYFARGPFYYRHFIPELENDIEAQVALVEIEINRAIETLSSTTHNPKPTSYEYLLRLGVMDNLRGNTQSLYLSVLNVFREKSKIINPKYLLDIADKLKKLYEASVKLQYSFLLGMDIDQDKVIEEFDSIDHIMTKYKKVAKTSPHKLKLKNPEIENSLLIAVRANKLIKQYPDVDVLIGLSSGGVELASVSKLLIKKIMDKDIDCIHYPISVHHGLSMWDRDKPHHKMTTDNYDLLGISSVKGKNVVICEDNSSSGQTLTRVKSIIEELGANRTNFAVIEIDPARMLMHRVQQKIGYKHNIGQAIKNERPIANYFYPDFVGAIGVVKVVPADHSINKVIAQDTANKYNKGHE